MHSSIKPQQLASLFAVRVSCSMPVRILLVNFLTGLCLSEVFGKYSGGVQDLFRQLGECSRSLGMCSRRIWEVLHCLTSITANQLTAGTMFLPDFPDSCFRKAINRNQLTANRRQTCLLAWTQVSSSQTHMSSS